MKRTILILLIIVISFFTSNCFSQVFGKNKVTDKKFDWMTYKTNHFIIYYYPSAERLVKTMGDMAEIGYAKISEILGHSIKKRIPLILYKSHSDFQQTNVILDTLDEGVGGFAELLKYRIVIPFTGSMDEFQKVITHEITHIFQYNILYKELLAHIYTGEFLYSPPIWFIEGMSEYMADNWGIDGETVLRDAVITNSIVPLTKLQDWEPLGSRVYLGYKQGLSAITYLAEKYGSDKLGEILNELALSRTKDMDSALKNTIGISLEEFDKNWMEYIKKKYWPEVGIKQYPASIGMNLTKDNNSYNNIKPVWSPSGDLIAYIAYYDNYNEIRIVSSLDGRVFSKITSHLRKQEYEYIREKGSGLSWSPDGDEIAFIGNKNSKDLLMIVNVLTGELVKKIEMPFDLAYSPAWSSDGKCIAIIGLKDCKSDIYSFNIEDGRMTQITSDIYDESSVSWHPKEDKIVYSSERNGRYKIFVHDLETNETTQLTYGRQNDLSPSWSSDGKKIVFCSNLNGIYDVYTMDNQGKNLTRLTNILTACFNPVLSPNGENLALSIFYNYKNDIYIIKSNEFINEKIEPLFSQEDEEPLYVMDDKDIRGVKYNLNFAPDLIYVNFGYISGGSLENTIQLIASDIMGDHRFSAGINAISIQSQPDLFLAYYYLKRKTDYGIALFNWNEFRIEGDNRFWQRTTGIEGYISYPWNKFNRMDFQLGRYLRFTEYTNTENDRTKKDSINALSASLINDSSQWSYFGPSSGKAYRFTIEQSLKISKRDLQTTNVIMDFRKYFKLGKRSGFATRLISAGSFGQDRENFYLGSSFRQSQGFIFFEKPLMRGYSNNEVFGTKVGLLNLEVRIPFIDELRFGWPVSWGIGGIRGVLFMDFAGVSPRPQNAKDIYGKIISYDEDFKPWIRDEQGFRLVDLRSAIGAGFRIGPFSFDFAKKTDFNKLGKGYKFHFGYGQEF